MTDEQAVPPTGDEGVGPTAPTSTATDAGAKAVVAVVSLLGVLLTGLCLVTADRLDRSAPARYLAVAAVVIALVAVLVALGGQLSTLLEKSSRRAVRLVLSAGLLSLVAVLLAGAAALFVVQSRQSVAGSTEPAVVVQSSSAGGGQNVTAQLSFPGLTAGTVVTATIAGESDDSSPNVLARSVVRVGVDGPGVVQLAAVVNPNDVAVIEAQAGDRKCKVSLPRFSEGDARLTCSKR